MKESTLLATQKKESPNRFESIHTYGLDTLLLIGDPSRVAYWRLFQRSIPKSFFKNISKKRVPKFRSNRFISVSVWTE